MNQQAYNTTKLLNLISTHLSSRPDCRHMTYEITLSQSTLLCQPLCIDFYPSIMVFPDRYHKKQSDKESIITHILSRHMSETPLGPDNLVLGTYKYVPSFTGKRRRWIRTK